MSQMSLFIQHLSPLVPMIISDLLAMSRALAKLCRQLALRYGTVPFLNIDYPKACHPRLRRRTFYVHLQRIQ